MQPLTKSICTKKDRIMSGLQQKAQFQLLLPTQDILRLAFAKAIIAMLMKGPPSIPTLLLRLFLHTSVSGHC